MFTVVFMGWCTTGVREVRTVGHVLLLPGLSIAGQENAGPAVAQEDGYRAVVGLARALARRRCEGVGLTALPRASCLCIFIHPTHVDLASRPKGLWIAPPHVKEAIYAG